MADVQTTAVLPLPSVRVRSRKVQTVHEWWIRATLIASAVFSIGITCTIVVVLSKEAFAFFQQPEVTVLDFFTSTVWSPDPQLGDVQSFGIWPLVSGTLLVTLVAMAVALPLGLVTAIFLSEYAPPRLRATLKPALEILAGIPTVVYGFFALTVINAGLRWMHPGFREFNPTSAGIAVGFLCLPIVSSLTEDALRAVPRSLREAAYGVGGTKFDVSVKVVVPAALSGIVAAFLLAFSRAIGETMIVALAAGSLARMTADPREPIQTMTGYMAQMVGGDVSHFGLQYLSLYAVAATLFLMTFALTIIGHRIRLRYREAYQ